MNKTSIIVIMRILLIEDDQQAASYLVKGLTESGYSIDHAADGEQGLNLSIKRNLRCLRKKGVMKKGVKKGVQKRCQVLLFAFHLLEEPKFY